MVEKTTMQVSTELKTILDSLKQKGDTYDDVIRSLIPGDKKTVDGDVLLSMTKEDYKYLMSRQTWPSTKDILESSIVPVYRKTIATCKNQKTCLMFAAAKR